MKVDFEKLEFGMKSFEWLGSQFNTEEVQTILNKLNLFETSDTSKKKKKDVSLFELSMTLKRVDIIAYVLRASIVAGGGKDPGHDEAREWCFANWISAIKIYVNYLQTLPGTGENDAEIRGNLKALARTEEETIATGAK